MDDKYGIPQRITNTMDDELMSLIGRTTVLGALLDNKVAALASSLDNGPQAYYFSSLHSVNRGIVKARIALYDGTKSEQDFGVSGIRFLGRTDATLARRHDIVHRIWSSVTLGVWSGHKAVKNVDDSVDWSGHDVYTRVDFEKVFRDLTERIDEASTLIATAGSFPRRADRWEDPSTRRRSRKQ